MKRVWRLSETVQVELKLLCGCSINLPANPLWPSDRRFFGELSVHGAPFGSSVSSFIPLFANKMDHSDAGAREDLSRKVSPLRDELLQISEDGDKVVALLEDKGLSLFRRYTDGAAFVELLKQLSLSPHLALEVFNWRRKQAVNIIPMTSEEYARGITVAGRQKNIDLAVEFFMEASNRHIKTNSTYNALMSAYMSNGFAEKCQSLFRELKMEAGCSPTITTYNILISVFGRLVLVDHMEATFKEVTDQNLSPTINTFNYLIAGYITAWMWDSMENIYKTMKSGTVKPDLSTHLLMLRGYANSGNLRRMEGMYAQIKHHVDQNELSLIRAMICAYCRSNDTGRIKKIEALLRHIPTEEYRPWLNVLLIKVYAEEDLIEEMEHLIHEAFEHNTVVSTNRIIRCIIASYYRNNAIDNLTNFARKAECSGWKLCRSIYHCKMCLYASNSRLPEMEKVLDEMDRMKINRSKKTFLILYKVYSDYGLRQKAEQTLGLMCTSGYGIPLTESTC